MKPDKKFLHQLKQQIKKESGGMKLIKNIEIVGYSDYLYDGRRKVVYYYNGIKEVDFIKA
jgi:hypothetical protein